MRYDTNLTQHDLDEIKHKCERAAIGKDFLPSPEVVLLLIKEVEDCWLEHSDDEHTVANLREDLREAYEEIDELEAQRDGK